MKKIKSFDEYVSGLIEKGDSFLKSDVRLPVDKMYKSLKDKLEKANSNSSGSLVGGIKPSKGKPKGYQQLCMLMIQSHLLKEAIRMEEGDNDKAFALHQKLAELQEKIDGLIQTSAGKGLRMESEIGVGSTDYSFANVFDARMKSQAQDEVNNLLEKAQTAEKATKKGVDKAGAIIKEMDKFSGKGFKKIKIKEDKNKNHSFGAFKVKEDKSPDKKIKFPGKKGGMAVATVSSKKVSCPKTSGGAKKIGGAKAPQMKGALKLFIDNKYADKYIKANPEVKNAESLGKRKIGGSAIKVKGLNAKKAGETAMQADAKKNIAKKSMEEESAEFNKSFTNRYFDRPALYPKTRR